MRGFDVRLVRVMVAAGAVIGSALVTSVAVAADEPAPIAEPVLVTDAPVTTPALPEVSDPPESTVPFTIDKNVPDSTVPFTIDKNVPDSTVPFTIDKNEPAIDDSLTIEIVGLESTPVGPVVSGKNVPAVVEMADTTAADTTPADTTAPDTTATEPDAGHGGASGGQGNPYRMTFSVVWLDPTGTPIAVLDAVLPTDWRSVFELSATSQTGKGMPTSATCTYPVGSDVLQCTFHNPGHGSGTDGLIVPARPTATYEVSVVWPSVDWKIDGANAGPYSARELCPRGGDGGTDAGGGHEGTDTGGGHEGTDTGGGHAGGGSGGEGGGVTCEHTVVFRQLAIAPTDDPVVDPVVDPVAEALPPVVTPSATSPAAAPAVATGSLAATGSSITMLLVIAGLLMAAGSALAALSRRTS
jgi:LPXTG-motif cell wall-anchored protein